MINEKHDFIKQFLASNPNEFELMDACELLFKHAEVKSSINNKTGEEFRSYRFILPDTVYFTYQRGVRGCLIYESGYQGYSVGVNYATIDDASMSFWVYVRSHEDMRIVFDKLTDILHFDRSTWRENIQGMMFVEPPSRTPEAWEKAVTELLAENVLPHVYYTLTFDYN